MEVENQKGNEAILLTIPEDMLQSLKIIAKSEYNTVQGICRKFIAEGIASASQR